MSRQAWTIRFVADELSMTYPVSEARMIDCEADKLTDSVPRGLLNYPWSSVSANEIEMSFIKRNAFMF